MPLHALQKEKTVRTPYCWGVFLVGFVLLFQAVSTPASLKEIQREKLPRDPSVEKAYADLTTIESMVRYWSQNWTFKTPKEEVVAQLKGSLKTIKEATAAHPENEELWLLTGLVAGYAYNLDLDGAYELAIDSLGKAKRLSPDDFRPQWFQSRLVCQTQKTKEGMDGFLALEYRAAPGRLPADFWDDYLFCTTVTNMPAHALRAADHLQALHASPSDYRDELVKINGKRFLAADAAESYKSAAIWSNYKTDQAVNFVNTMFGFQFSTPPDWKISLGDAQGGQTAVQIEMNSFKTTAGEVTPNILIVARRPRNGETLDEFMKTFLKGQPAVAAKVSECPSQECIAAEQVGKGMYGAAGDGHAIMAAFQREEPAFPGILFEQPLGLPDPGESKEVKYYHPEERFHRLQGTLYYFVLLDTASSILDRATIEYAKFLLTLKAE